MQQNTESGTQSKDKKIEIRWGTETQKVKIGKEDMVSLVYGDYACSLNAEQLFSLVFNNLKEILENKSK